MKRLAAAAILLICSCLPIDERFYPNQQAVNRFRTIEISTVDFYGGGLVEGIPVAVTAEDGSEEILENPTGTVSFRPKRPGVFSFRAGGGGRAVSVCENVRIPALFESVELYLPPSTQPGEPPRFSVIEYVSDDGIRNQLADSVLSCAPPTVYKMLIHADFNKYDLSALVKADVAGEALNPEVFERFQNGTGIKLHEGFGQTETCVMMFTNQWIEPKPGSMGMPAAGWDVQLLDEGGRPVPAGTVGEICVSLKNGRPVGLFQGYHKNEKLTAKVFRDGFYHTGDVAYRDNDGYYWFVGRNDDLIKTSGYRVSPFEVESVLLEHPAVREVAVTGIPDPSRGMAVKATIVLNKYFQGTDVLVRQLQDHVRARTASYKYPRVIEFVDSLPMTISGKIRRALIRTLDSAKDTIIEPVKSVIGLGKDDDKEK